MQDADRELLELAAKAAGIPRLPGWMDEGCAGLGIKLNHAQQVEFWNPLTDDGDAFRLAVKATLGVVIAQGTSYAAHCDAQEQLTEPNDMGRDPYAATRRAIVRAAAAIGKEMP